MTASRSQHIIPAALVFVIGCIVMWYSFTGEPAQAYTFPRLISVFFVALASWNLFRAVAGLAKVGEGISPQVFKNILPGTILMLLFVFVLAKLLGFYVASTLTFLAIYTVYDPVPVTSLKDWGKRIIVTLLFMGVIYCLFWLLLQVQTPRGIFF